MKAASDTVGFEQIEHANLTDVGIRRSHNQDAFGVLLAPTAEAWRERGHIFLVADGMGAHAVGELASAIAADSIPHTYQKHASLGPEVALRKAFDEANANIHQRGLQNREFQGMGTTASALLLRPEGAWVAHVGDSRVYRIRGNQVEQLSFDHSLQWELARRQQVSPDSIAGIPSNVIVRSLGPETNVQIDIEGPHPVFPGDAYLLCSDGLSNQLTDQELGAILKYLPLQEACQFLVDLANLRGGPDNITVIAVRIPGEQEELHGSSLSLTPLQKGLTIVPWPTMLLTLGSILAIVALFFAVDRKYMGFGIGFFVLSAIMILSGIAGILMHRRHEAAAAALEEFNDSLKVYRRQNAQLDSTLIEKFMQTETNLLEIIKEKGWSIEEGRLRNLRKTVAEQMKKQDFVAAFKAQCQALSLLTEKLRQHRNKDEQFKPNW
jgi:serine/threonine protein phosphatase PrpC